MGANETYRASTYAPVNIAVIKYACFHPIKQLELGDFS